MPSVVRHPHPGERSEGADLSLRLCEGLELLRMINGDGGLRCEQLDATLILLAESVQLRVLNGEHADDTPPDLQRHRELRADPFGRGGADVDLDVIFILTHVADVFSDASAQYPPSDPGADFRMVPQYL